jgi:maltose-binding protein MalE
MQFSFQNTSARNIIRLIISELVIGSMLVGCGAIPLPGGNANLPTATLASNANANTSSDNPATPIPSATIPVELSNLKGSEIRIIHPWSGESAEVVRDLISQFNQGNVWGIKVDEVVGGSTSETARAFVENMQTSDRMNIVVIPPEYLASWKTGGTIIDLTSNISNPEWGIQSSPPELDIQYHRKPANRSSVPNQPAISCL